MEQKRRPAETPFKQQNLKAWQPILTPIPVITTFLIVGIVFIPIGAVLLASSQAVVEVSQRYDNVPNCSFRPSQCSVTLTVEQTMSSPVYLYYGLNNFYQNNRRYVQSRNDYQLRGITESSYSSLSSCTPLISVNNSQNSQDLYLPCGLIAWSMFNDSFILFGNENQIIPLRKQGIAWSSDVNVKFRNPLPNAPGVRLIPDFQDEDFIVWMRTAGLPNFRKLYRIIDQDLPPGNYTVLINNHFNVEDFGGEKHVILSTTSWIGGKNNFLGAAYIAVGGACFLLGIFFGCLHKFRPRKLGDTTYLEWNK